jgi:hypothetical protein
VLLLAAPGTGARVLLEALTPAFESAAPPPFAFALDDAAHGLAAGRAAEARGVADGHQGGFMATWPTAAGRRQNSFCSVTTRCRSCRCLCGLRQSPGTQTAHALGLGVLGFGGGVLASAGLTLGCLPEPEPSSAVGILAVTLVPASRLVSAATALA